jgi:hypothetical protein
MRTTLADARASRIPNVIGACSDDVRFLAILNEAIQRLLTKGLWWGTYARYRICATDSCITLPSGIATIETVAMCGTPIQLVDQWYEFLENGLGTVGGSLASDGSNCSSCAGSNNAGCGVPGAYMRGRYPSFSDVRGTTEKLRFVCDLATDVGKEVLALGYDENSNWIRTEQGGVIRDGEIIELDQSPGTTSDHYFSAMTDLQFPNDMDGQTWLYAYKPSDDSQRLIGKYQYHDTRPSFARYFIPGICPNSDSSCPVTVEIMAKLEFLPVKNDTDYLIIGNLPALKTMCMAINNAEHEPDAIKKTAIMRAGYSEAIAELDSELDHYLGSGRRIGLNVMGSSINANDPVPVLI